MLFQRPRGYWAVLEPVNTSRRADRLLTSLSSAEAAELAASIGNGVLVGVPGTGVLLCESTAVSSDPPYRCPPGHSPLSIQWHMFSSRWNMTRSCKTTTAQFSDGVKSSLHTTMRQLQKRQHNSLNTTCYQQWKDNSRDCRLSEWASSCLTSLSTHNTRRSCWKQSFQAINCTGIGNIK